MEATTLTTVGRALRRRHWLVWGALLLGCAAALAASTLRHPTYRASAVLALDETQATNQGFDIAVQADQYLTDRYIAMATSQPVLATVCTAEGPGCDPQALSRRVTATALKTTGLLEISATASTPAASARLANEVAREVVARNRSEVDAYLGPQRQLLQSQLSQLDLQIAAVQRSLDQAQTPFRTDASVSNAIAPLLVQLQQLQLQYGATYGKLQDVQVLQTRLGTSLMVEDPARPPLTPIDPDPVRYLLVGAAGGLAMGLLSALLLERYDDRLRDAAELADASGAPVVLAVDGREPAVLSAPYRFLSPGSSERAGRVQVALVAASPHEPVDDVGLAMAEAVIEQHHRVLVVTARPPALNGSASPAPDEAPGSDLVVQAGWARDGRYAARPDAFDLTIRCLPGPAWVTPSTGPAILVATRDRTRMKEARRTAEVLRRAGVEPAAAILLAPNAVARWRRHRAAAAGEHVG